MQMTASNQDAAVLTADPRQKLKRVLKGLLRPAFCSPLTSSGQHALRGIEVYYLRYAGKGNLDDLAVGALYLDAWRGQGLRSLHTTNYPPNALSVGGDNLHIVFAV
jgi:hypothetical protein